MTETELFQAIHEYANDVAESATGRPCPPLRFRLDPEAQEQLLEVIRDFNMAEMKEAIATMRELQK